MNRQKGKQGTSLSILSGKEGDYISLTDMLMPKDGEFFISDWLWYRNAFAFLGPDRHT